MKRAVPPWEMRPLLGITHSRIHLGLPSLDHVRTHSPKDDVFQVKWILDDASCGHTNAEHILLRWHKGWHGDPVDVRQVTVRGEQGAETRRRKKGPSHSGTLPQPSGNPAKAHDPTGGLLRASAGGRPLPPSCDYGENTGQSLLWNLQISPSLLWVLGSVTTRLPREPLRPEGWAPPAAQLSSPSRASPHAHPHPTTW